MCGIVGYIGKRDATPILLEGLHRLEYRGYDSAGIAVVRDGALRTAKCKGRVRDLEQAVPPRFRGSPGIAHTRWATHGEPSDRNAHPHLDTNERIAVIHNGIIENANALRRRLEGEGVVFRSETDTEVLAHLIAAMPGESLLECVRAALRLVTGTWGLAVLDADRPDTIVVAQRERDQHLLRRRRQRPMPHGAQDAAPALAEGPVYRRAFRGNFWLGHGITTDRLSYDTIKFRYKQLLPAKADRR
jgi:glucosamine--fructose-6-phosphate aminotransferase (isomerizing)